MRPKISLTKQPKIAIVHDYLNQYGGGERVLQALNELWPKANIYTSVYDRKLMRDWLNIDESLIKLNFISKLPFSNYLSKHYFFLYPSAFRFQDVGEADIVLSDTSYASKFARGKKGALRICYIYTPSRFLWGYDTELEKYYHRPFDKFLNPLYNLFIPPAKNILRKMDFDVAQKIDYFVCISEEIRKRIKKHYNRDAYVIYPPVDVDRFKSQVSSVKSQGGYFLVVSRLGGYKKVGIVVEAFNKLGFPLKIVGVGPQLDYLKSIAKDNVEFLGRLNDKDTTELMKSCTALIFPTHEDFGIVPVEAMAAGKPVIAYKKGGALETVVEGVTGEFFQKQTVGDIIETVKKFKAEGYDAKACRAQAKKFSKHEFKRKFKFFVEEVYVAKHGA